MTTSVRARIAVGVVGAMLLTLVPLIAGANHINDHRNIILPDPNPNGPTQWSIRWSGETFDSATDFLIGSAADFPDALASGSLQGSTTPLLLTDPASLSEGILEEVDRLGAVSFDVVGGEAAVSQAVVDELQAEGLVFRTRYEGPTRFETAVDIAEGTVATTVLVVRGEGADEPTQAFADALAAGGWAADQGFPVLLTQTDQLHPAVEAFLEATPTITNAIIVGGEAAVGGTNAAQLEALDLTVTRVAGDSRAGTAIAVAQARGFDAVAEAGRFIVVDGQQADGYAVGFPAAAHSALADAPIVLVAGSEIPPETAAWFDGEPPRGGQATTGDPIFICGAAPSVCVGPVRDAIGLPNVGTNGATVTLANDAGPYEVGDVLEGTAVFDPDFTATLSLTGPCIDDGEVPVENETYRVEITSGTADEGSEDNTCTIRYTVTYDNGSTQVGAFPTTIVPGDGGGGGLPLPVPLQQ